MFHAISNSSFRQYTSQWNNILKQTNPDIISNYACTISEAKFDKEEKKNLLVDVLEACHSSNHSFNQLVLYCIKGLKESYSFAKHKEIFEIYKEKLPHWQNVKRINEFEKYVLDLVLNDTIKTLENSLLLESSPLLGKRNWDEVSNNENNEPNKRHREELEFPIFFSETPKLIEPKKKAGDFPQCFASKQTTELRNIVLEFHNNTSSEAIFYEKVTPLLQKNPSLLNYVFRLTISSADKHTILSYSVKNISDPSLLLFCLKLPGPKNLEIQCTSHDQTLIEMCVQSALYSSRRKIEPEHIATKMIGLFDSGAFLTLYNSRTCLQLVKFFANGAVPNSQSEKILNDLLKINNNKGFVNQESFQSMLKYDSLLTLNAVKLFLSFGTKLDLEDQNGKTPFDDYLKLLESKDAPFCNEEQLKHESILTFLLEEKGLIVNESQQRHLFFAITAIDSLTLLKSTLQLTQYNLADLGLNGEGETLLHFGLRMQSVQILHFLLKNKLMDRNLLDTYKKTAFHYLCTHYLNTLHHFEDWNGESTQYQKLMTRFVQNNDYLNSPCETFEAIASNDPIINARYEILTQAQAILRETYCRCYQYIPLIRRQEAKTIFDYLGLQRQCKFEPGFFNNNAKEWKTAFIKEKEIEKYCHISNP